VYSSFDGWGVWKKKGRENRKGGRKLGPITAHCGRANSRCCNKMSTEVAVVKLQASYSAYTLTHTHTHTHFI